MTIDFDDIPDPVDESSGSSIDKLEWESAELLAKSLNKGTTVSSKDNTDENDVDMEALAKAARDAVEMFEQQFEHEKKETQRQREQWTAQQSVASDNDVTMSQPLADIESAWKKMTLAELKFELGKRGLAKSGTKASLVARLVEYQSVSTSETSEEKITAASVQSDASTTDGEIRDWVTLKVADLRVELNRRGLPTTGKKADLVAALRESDIALQKHDTAESDAGAQMEPRLSNTIMNEDIEKVAKAAREAVAMFEETNGKIGDSEEFEDVFKITDELFDEDEDISLDDLDLDIDLDALGKAARDAVMKMESDDDEPSDEALWEIENEIALVDESFLVPPDDDGESILTMANLDKVEEAIPKVRQQRTDPLPNYASMAVSQLKEELNRRGLRVTGKKIDLIARLEASDNESL